MVQNLYENNMVTISGKIATDPVFNHEVYGEGFYTFMLDVKRLSESYDRIPVTVSERLINFPELKMGIYVRIEGQFRSYNATVDGSSKLILTVFAREVYILDEESDGKINENQIVLNGFKCKKPVYRTTPIGNEISDIL